MSDEINLNIETNDPKQLWIGMPEFFQERIKPYSCIIIRVADERALKELSQKLEQPLTKKTKSVWYPFRSHWGLEKKTWFSDES